MSDQNIFFPESNHVTPQPEPVSSIAGSVLPLQRAEELLSSLSEVVSARIVVDGTGGVDAIHVLVTGTQTPKQMVRNIESALMAQLGMRVDHRKISVATTVKRPESPPMPQQAVVPDAAVAPVLRQTPMESAPPVPDPQGSPRRELYFEDVEMRGSRTKGMICKVTILRGDERIVGEAEGSETDRSRVELSARATLAAIGMVDSMTRSMTLEGAKVVQAFDRELVLVGVMVRQGRGSTLLTGSCEIRDSAETASALAVLSATNRWVERMK